MSARRLLSALALASLLGPLLASPAAADLAGSEWVPTALESGRVAERAGVFVTFRGEGRLFGRAGCDRIAGRYEVAMLGGGDGGEIGKGLVVAVETRASADSEGDCPPQAEALGRAFLDTLARARSYLRQRADLVLYDAQGRPIAHLRQTDWD